MKAFNRTPYHAFSLTEALVGILIFVAVIFMGASALKIITNANATNIARNRAETMITSALNDLKVKAGTGTDFFYDAKFAATYYYPKGGKTKSDDYLEAEATGKVRVEAQVGLFSTFNQVRPIKFIARWRIGPREYTMEKTNNLTGSRLAEYGGEVTGKIIYAPGNGANTGKGIAGIGVAIESEVGNNWIYAFTDKEGNFFLRGVKLGASRQFKIMGYTTVPSFYFRKGDIWKDSVITHEEPIDGELQLNSVMPIGPYEMTPFGGIKGGANDGVNGDPIPNAIIQLVPIRTEIPDYYSGANKSYQEKLTDADGQYHFENLCPGFYLVFMHGSAEDNLTQSEDLDFGSSFSQAPRITMNYYYWPYPGKWAFESTGLNPTPKLYAAVGTKNDLSWDSLKNDLLFDNGPKSDLAIRVNFGETYDSRDGVHKTLTHRHSHPAGLSITDHGNYKYHRLNTQFYSTFMMHLKGHLVGVQLNSATGKFTNNSQDVADCPIRVYMPAHYTAGPATAAKKAVRELHPLLNTHAFNNHANADGYKTHLGLGGFVRQHYYFSRWVKSDSDGNFCFYHLGPRMLEGNYRGSGGTPVADTAMYQGAWARLMIDRSEALTFDWPPPLSTVVTPFPSNVVPVFVIDYPFQPADPTQKLEQFAVVPNPSWGGYSPHPTVLIPSKKTFPTPGAYYTKSYGGFEENNLAYFYTNEDDDPNWKVMSFPRRSTASPNQRYYDLGDVRMLRKTELVSISGDVRDIDNPGSLLSIPCSGGVVTTWGIDLNPGYERFTSSLTVTAADMTFSFNDNVLPSLPNWDTFPNDMGGPGEFVDGKWGYGNNRVLHFRCMDIETWTNTLITMEMHLMRKTASGSENPFDNYSFYTAADVTGGAIDPFEFQLCPGPSSQSEAAYPILVSNNMNAVEIQDLGDHIVRFVTPQNLNLPNRRLWSGSTPAMVGIDRSDVHILVSTNPSANDRPEIYGRLISTANWRKEGAYACPSGCRYVQASFKYEDDGDFYEGYDIGRSSGIVRLYHRVTGTKVGGYITGPDGEPLHNARVQIRLTCKDPSNSRWPNSPCSYFMDVCKNHDVMTDENGYYSFTDTSKLVFGGYMMSNFQIRAVPPASCSNCRPSSLPPYRDGIFFDGHDGFVKDDANIRFLPRTLDPTEDTGGPGGA